MSERKAHHTVKVQLRIYELPQLRGPQDGIELDDEDPRWFATHFVKGRPRRTYFSQDFEKSCSARNKLWDLWKRQGLAYISKTRKAGERKPRTRPVLTPCSIVMLGGVVKHFKSIAQRDHFLRRRKTDRTYVQKKETTCPRCKGESEITKHDQTKTICPKCLGLATIRVPTKQTKP